MSNPASDSLVVFTLDEHSFAVSLGAVARVVGAVEIVPLPEAPPGVRGLINVQGKVLPVFDPRAHCGILPRELRLSDQLIILRTKRREVALLVDAVVGVMPHEKTKLMSGSDILPDYEAIEGIMKLSDGLILIQDINRFLTWEETEALQTALELQSE